MRQNLWQNGFLRCNEVRIGRLTGDPFTVRYVRIRKPAPAPRNDADLIRTGDDRRSGRLDRDREFLVAPLKEHAVRRLLYLDVG